MDPPTLRLSWMLILSVYVLAASSAPVWVILQPRDFINVFTLIGGMVLLAVATVAGGFQGLAIDPAMGWTIADGTAKLGVVWPILFITVACGAISGFHALVTSGTSAKQCAVEGDARRVGFGAMLTEGALAVLVLCAIGAGLGHSGLMAAAFPAQGAGNPVLGFSLGMGLLAQQALGLPAWLGTIFGLLMVEGFLVTTLDTAVRLNRYLFEELWQFLLKDRTPKLLLNTYFNSALSVALMLALAIPNGWKLIWPVFGTANQLLAALTLCTVSIWLALRARPAWFTLGPALFMMATCLNSLWLVLSKEFAKSASGGSPSIAVVILGLLLLGLSLGVIWIAGTSLLDIYRGRREIIRSDAADAYGTVGVGG